MINSIDRNKYMSTQEVQRLGTVSEAWAITDLQKGRTRGPLTWIVVDLALQTGLRVSEIALLRVGDFDIRRRSLRVWRLKRRKPVQETMALSRELADHLRHIEEAPPDTLAVRRMGTLAVADITIGTTGEVITVVSMYGTWESTMTDINSSWIYADVLESTRLTS